MNEDALMFLSYIACIAQSWGIYTWTDDRRTIYKNIIKQKKPFIQMSKD